MANRKPSLEALKAEIESRRAELGLSYEELGKGADTDRGTVYSALTSAKTSQGLDKIIEPLATTLEYADADALYAAARARETGDLPGAYHCLSVGATETLWFHACGTGSADDDMRASDFKFILDLSPKARIVLDDEMRAAVDRTKGEQEGGLHQFENNQVFFMRQADFNLPRGRDERTTVRATLVLDEYALFYTLTRSEHGRSLLWKRMQSWQKGEVIPVLSGGVGIGIAILSSDGKFIFGRREISQGPRPQQLDVGSVEGFSPRMDFERRSPPRQLISNKSLDVDWAARRGLREEYGIEADEIASLHYLGFGYDLEYGQWNVMALAQVSKTGEQIERRRKYAKHQEFWETIRVAAKPKPVFETIAADKNPVWSFGIALSFFSMVRLHGKRKAESVAEGVNMRPSGFKRKD